MPRATSICCAVAAAIRLGIAARRVVTRSYLVEHTSPKLILGFHEKELTGWNPLGKVDGGPDATPSIQYSLELHTS